MLNPGRLRHRVTIQTPSITRDASGGEVVVWVDSAVRRAEIKPLSGREQLLAQQVNAQLTHDVTMRYDSLLAPTARLLFGARVLYIPGVMNEEERNRYVTMRCEEVVR